MEADRQYRPQLPPHPPQVDQTFYGARLGSSPRLTMSSVQRDDVTKNVQNFRKYFQFFEAFCQKRLFVSQKKCISKTW